jgi:hypothetical protein
MEDSEAQASSVDIDDDGSDSQEPQLDDPTQQVLGVNEVQTIGMYVCMYASQSCLYVYI